MSAAATDERNAWRSESPARGGRTLPVRAGDPDKLLMVSADAHANEPAKYLAERIPREFAGRIPRIEVDESGAHWIITEGTRPQLVKRGPSGTAGADGNASARQADADRQGARMEAEDVLRSSTGKTIEQRLADQASDGIDIELIFPNKGLLCWATPDPVLAAAMCHAWNEWAYEWFGGADGWNDGRTRPLACVATGRPDLAAREAQWAREHGFVGLCLGNEPIYGPKVEGNLEYNDPSFEPFWALCTELDLPLTFHVSTGRDPRSVVGQGGAVINYVCHSMQTTIEPLVQLISSGVFERYPTLRAGLVESGIGFLPWMLETMDYAFKAHHFFVRPLLAELPSHYFRQNCFATFQEDHAGVQAVERHDLAANVMWANDYPHHEGSWPHSAASIERQMGGWPLAQLQMVLGQNAARVFNL